jgi:DNA repair exonuclease SbcCD ATPase subunit
MFFPDVLKFLNRLGVRPVNDVTAQVTAGVTAGMDPEGMGAHMGAGASSGKQSVGGRPNTRSLEENCDIMGDHMVKNFERVNMLVRKLNTLNDNVEIIQERVVNMESNMAAKDKEIGKIQASGNELEERVDTKMTDLEERMDAKGAGLEDIIEEKDKCFEAKDRELEAKTPTLEQRLASLESALGSNRAADSPAKALAPKCI